jgi:hypothetical protein
MESTVYLRVYEINRKLAMINLISTVLCATYNQPKSLELFKL